MSGWAAEPQTQVSAQEGNYVVAGMVRRVVAWIIDQVISGLLILIPVVVALASGAVGINQTALDQLRGYPESTVSVPLLVVNPTGLAVAAAIYVVMLVAYFPGCWWAIRGTIGQRLLSLHIARIEGPDNLPFSRAMVRWLVMSGVWTILSAVVAAMIINLLSTVPFSATSYGAGTNLSGVVAIDPRMQNVDTVSNLSSLGSTLWSILLLVTAGTHALKQGLHDRVAGSIVLMKAPVISPWAPGAQWLPNSSAPAGTGWSTPSGYPQGGYPQGGYAGMPPNQPTGGDAPSSPAGSSGPGVTPAGPDDTRHVSPWE